jgi:molybdenum cofactor biosynthesis protein B
MHDNKRTDAPRPGRGGIRILTICATDHRPDHVDDAGEVLDKLLVDAGYTVVRHVLLKKNVEYIKERVQQCADDNEAEAVIISGGTGIAQRDSTPEAVEGIFDKRIDGFGEAMRRFSFDEVGPFAMLTRATAGLVNQCVVFVIPNRPAAVKLAAEKLIIPTLEHMVDLALNRASVLPPPPYI